MAAAAERDQEPIDQIACFVVDAESDSARVTLALRGELDIAGAPSLQREIEGLDWPQLAELVFDLTDLTFIDSTGLYVLIRASQRAATAGLRFSIVRVADQPRKLFTIAGVTDSLNVQP